MAASDDMVPPHMKSSASWSDSRASGDDFDSDDDYGPAGPTASVEGFVSSDAGAYSSPSSDQQQNTSEKIAGCMSGPKRSLKTHISIRRYHVMIAGSVAQLCDKQRRVWRCFGSSDGKYAICYRSVDTDPGAKRVGNPKKALIHRASVESVASNFPCDLLLKCNLWRGNLYAGGKRGFMVVHRDSPPKYYSKSRVVHIAHDSSFRQEFSTYRNLAPEDLQAHRTRTGYRLIPVYKRGGVEVSPLFNIFRRNQEAYRDQYNVEDQKDIEGELYITVPEKSYRTALRSIRKQVTEKQPYVDMTSLAFKVARPGCKWASPIAAVADCEQEYQESVVSKVCTLTAVIEIAYELEGH